MNTKKYISDIVTVNEIQNWSSNEIIIIDAPTGSGKSHFIKNTLCDYAHSNNKNILMLIHRKNCVNQFKIELSKEGKLDTIEILTYQKLEAMINNQHEINLNKYDYIVLDEYHYNISDSAFNKYTDLSINLMLSLTNKVRIFMSATGQEMKQYIKGYRGLHTIDYELPNDFTFINSLTFYNKTESLEMIMQQTIEENRKTIFFIQSAKTAYDLYKKYPNYSLFVCSASNTTYYKHVNKDKLYNLLKNERFEDLILITTTALDAGINIKDTELKYIIIDNKDTNSLIQCLGRKRILNDTDKVDVLIKSISNQALGGMMTQLITKRSMAKYLKDNGLQSYLEKYKRDSDKYSLVYDEYAGDGKAEKKINYLMYFKMLLDSTEIESIINLYGKFAYNKNISRKLGFYNEETGKYMYKMLVENDTSELENYLNSIVGKKLYKEDQKELKEIFIKNGLKARTLGINTMNGNLKDSKMNYMIVSKRSSERIEGKIKSFTYWEVIKDIIN